MEIANLKPREKNVSQKGFVQYFLIYLLLQFAGGRVAAFLGSDMFYAGSIVLCLTLLLFQMYGVRFKSDFVKLECALLTSMLVTIVVTMGNLSFGTVLSTLSRFLIVYTAIQIDKAHFIERFLKLTVFLAGISLVLFSFVQIVGEEIALRFFSLLPELENGKSWLGNAYGIFFICYNFMDASRNAYMFGEPGEYQMVLSTAIFLLMFFGRKLSIRRQKIFLIILIVTLLTAMSTTGYLNLIAIVIVGLISRRSSVSKGMKRIFALTVVAGIIYIIFFYTRDSFIYRNFVAKLFGEDGGVDLGISTGAARTEPIELFIQTIKTMPEKLVFGVGYEGLSATPLGGYVTDGLINMIVMQGVITTAIVYGTMIAALIRTRVSIVQALLGIFIVLTMGITQPDLLSVMSVLICMYGVYAEIDSKEKTDCDSTCFKEEVTL